MIFLYNLVRNHNWLCLRGLIFNLPPRCYNIRKDVSSNGSFTLLFCRIYHLLFYLFRGFEYPMVLAYAGSEICYFKNGVCQGSAFKDIPGGRYYPAASMYTEPGEPNCIIKFNFGPNFEFLPQDFGGLPIPQPMSLVPHQAYEVKNEGTTENAIAG